MDRSKNPLLVALVAITVAAIAAVPASGMDRVQEVVEKPRVETLSPHKVGVLPSYRFELGENWVIRCGLERDAELKMVVRDPNKKNKAGFVTSRTYEGKEGLNLLTWDGYFGKEGAPDRKPVYAEKFEVTITAKIDFGDNKFGEESMKVRVSWRLKEHRH